MDRQTAATLEDIFAIIGVIFLLLWAIFVVVPAAKMIDIDNPSTIVSSISSMLWNTYFILMLVLGAIPSSIFQDIKSKIDKNAKQTQQVVSTSQMQQQQQQIVVNIPPSVTPVMQHDATMFPTYQRPPSIPPTVTVFCIQCGSENRKDAKFCKVCGASIE
jgi:hypothetical protein